MGLSINPNLKIDTKIAGKPLIQTQQSFNEPIVYGGEFDDPLQITRTTEQTATETKGVERPDSDRPAVTKSKLDGVYGGVVTKYTNEEGNVVRYLVETDGPYVELNIEGGLNEAKFESALKQTMEKHIQYGRGDKVADSLDRIPLLERGELETHNLYRVAIEPQLLDVPGVTSVNYGNNESFSYDENGDIVQTKFNHDNTIQKQRHMNSIGYVTKYMDSDVSFEIDYDNKTMNYKSYRNQTEYQFDKSANNDAIGKFLASADGMKNGEIPDSNLVSSYTQTTLDRDGNATGTIVYQKTADGWTKEYKDVEGNVTQTMTHKNIDNGWTEEYKDGNGNVTGSKTYTKTDKQVTESSTTIAENNKEQTYTEIKNPKGLLMKETTTVDGKVVNEYERTSTPEGYPAGVRRELGSNGELKERYEWKRANVGGNNVATIHYDANGRELLIDEFMDATTLAKSNKVVDFTYNKDGSKIIKTDLDPDRKKDIADDREIKVSADGKTVTVYYTEKDQDGKRRYKKTEYDFEYGRVRTSVRGKVGGKTVYGNTVATGFDNKVKVADLVESLYFAE